MSTSLISQYSQRCDLNLESFATMNFFWQFNKNPEATLRRFQVDNTGIFVVCTNYLSQQHTQEGGEWNGFVNTLKHFIHREVDHTKNVFAKELDKVRDNQKETDDKLNAFKHSKEKIMTDVEKLLPKEPEKPEEKKAE